MTARLGRPYEVLLVDDDPGDIALISEAFIAHGPAIRLHVAGDGIEALDFLRREGSNADGPRPDLVLLDLNMPRMGGRELLSVIKSDIDLTTIPVVMFSTSDRADDIAASYSHHANAYVTKPLDLEEFDRVISRIYSFYGELVTAPRPAA
jgi:two-component system response regulator